MSDKKAALSGFFVGGVRFLFGVRFWLRVGLYAGSRTGGRPTFVYSEHPWSSP